MQISPSAVPGCYSLEAPRVRVENSIASGLKLPVRTRHNVRIIGSLSTDGAAHALRVFRTARAQLRALASVRDGSIARSIAANRGR
jgi:hypothetical protein